MLTHALKEWSVAVDALLAGETIVLLRKGGIREVGGRFQVDGDRAILYPTYEHQKPHLLKPEYADRVSPVPSGWHPETVPIGGWADITEVVAVHRPEAVEALLPFHIWNDRLASERFRWKPSQPLSVLLLRVYQLRDRTEIPYRSEYGGCRSWIELKDAIAIDYSTPVLDDREYNCQVQELRSKIESV